MNLTDYQNFCKTTAIYNERFRGEYPEHALIEEAGELNGKRAKCLRDNDGVLSDEIVEAMLKECGDVCWQVCALATDSGIVLSADSVLEKMHYLSGNNDLRDLLKRMASHAVFAAIEMDCRSNELEYTIAYIGRIAWVVSEGRVILPDIFDRNAAKLTARKAKGTLSGSGDER